MCSCCALIQLLPAYSDLLVFIPTSITKMTTPTIPPTFASWLVAMDWENSLINVLIFHCFWLSPSYDVAYANLCQASLRSKEVRKLGSLV